MNRNKLLNQAKWLAIFTIVYNIIEGLVSIAYGISDETLALFGFGVDSFVEVISGIGILHMVNVFGRQCIIVDIHIINKPVPVPAGNAGVFTD